MTRRFFFIGTVAYIVLIIIVAPTLFSVPLPLFLSDDAAYSGAAIHLLHQSFYSLDGMHAYMDREPGQSVFLAFVYAVFGVENPFGVFFVQSFLLYISSFIFSQSLGVRFSRRVGGITFLLLLTSGSILHTVFAAYRECLTLSLFLLFIALYFSFEKRVSAYKFLVASLLMAGIILTYYSFIYLPFVIAVVLLIERYPKKYILLFLVLTYGCLSFWSYRNYSALGHFRVISDRRADVCFFVRGEQAINIHGWEPARCLWAEYVSRDYSTVSSSCNFNTVMHRQWPNGFDLDADYSEYGRIGKARILAHPLSYLQFSFFEIVELHLPYVGGGWSRFFNEYALLTQIILYIGFLFGLQAVRDQRLWMLTLIILYNITLFSLTDAIPRYLPPVLFCYVAIAAIGYDKLLQYFPRLYTHVCHRRCSGAQ